MYYEPYKRGRDRAGGGRRGLGCVPRLAWFLVKAVVKIAILLVILAVIAYALPPSLFLVEPEADLGIAADLPNDCVNILLLGVDALNSGSQRSDTMMILSVGYNTVRLTSILRDCVVEIEGHGSTKINAAYAYGGAELAMRTVNSNFGMNITKYVVVDFLTLARLIDAVGGVDVVVSQEEMRHVNYNNRAVAYAEQSEELLGYKPQALQEYSQDGETPVHLDGLQALGFARIRKLDSDFGRTTRQREVFAAALTSMRKNAANPLMYARLIKVLLEDVKTNLGYVEIVSMAMKALVCGEVEQLRLPVADSYTDNGSRITIDTGKNAQALRLFIYGQ